VLAFEPVPHGCDAWRFVENQGPSATVRVTDTLAEQDRLEQLLDMTKPVMPPACVGYDFLLATPFRYRPYPEGSRFRRAGQEEGVFYGAETVDTALAEKAFYRYLFFSESPDMAKPTRPVEISAFMVRVRTPRAISLFDPPFDQDADLWTHPTDYRPCQDLADKARAADIQLIRYTSVRCPKQGVALAVLDIRAFLDPAPKERQTWHLLVRDRVVQAWCECPKRQMEFQVSAWAEQDARLRLARGTTTGQA
jgi:hypothetical protein